MLAETPGPPVERELSLWRHRLKPTGQLHGRDRCRALEDAVSTMYRRVTEARNHSSILRYQHPRCTVENPIQIGIGWQRGISGWKEPKTRRVSLAEAACPGSRVTRGKVCRMLASGEEARRRTSGAARSSVAWFNSPSRVSASSNRSRPIWRRPNAVDLQPCVVVLFQHHVSYHRVQSMCPVLFAIASSTAIFK